MRLSMGSYFPAPIGGDLTAQIFSIIAINPLR